MTYQEAVTSALRDYRAFLGKQIRPDQIDGYEGSNSVTIITGRKVLVRIVETRTDDLRHDTGGFLDPYWNIEVVDDPDGLLAEVRSPWMFGPAKEYA